MRYIPLLILLSGIGWMLGLSVFVSQIPKEVNSSQFTTDAAIVLTGGSKRVHHGFIRVAEGLAKQVFVSGVNNDATPKAVIDQASKEVSEISEDDITLGYDARSTIGNAEEVKHWVKESHITSIRVITANYHMPRSLSELRFVLDKSVIIIADPVFPDKFDINGWLSDSNSRRLVFSEYHKFLASKFRHILIKLNLINLWP